MIGKIFRRKQSKADHTEPTVPEPPCPTREYLKGLYGRIVKNGRSINQYITEIDRYTYAVDEVKNMDLSDEKSELSDLGEAYDELQNKYNQVIINCFPDLSDKINNLGDSSLTDDDLKKIDSDIELRKILNELRTQIQNNRRRYIKLLDYDIKPIEDGHVRRLAISNIKRYEIELAGELCDFDKILTEYKQLDISNSGKDLRKIYGILSGQLWATKDIIDNSSENVKMFLADKINELEVPMLQDYLSEQFVKDYQ